VYELIDVESGNLSGEFDTEDEALEAVRDDIGMYGIESIDTLAMGVISDDGRDVRCLAKGRDLAELALARAPKKRSA
jgi:hypothetical protein